MAAAEVGTLFCTLVLITGPIWARPIWGVWWTWDPRLTMTLIMWAIYAGYVMLRAFGGDEDATSRYAAVLGIVGALAIPAVHYSVLLLQGIHPAVLTRKRRRLRPGRPDDAHDPPRLDHRHAAAGMLADEAAHSDGPPRDHGAGTAPGTRIPRRSRRMTGNLGYLFAAYTAVWLGIFFYVRRLARRGQELEEEVRELQRRVQG